MPRQYTGISKKGPIKLQPTKYDWPKIATLFKKTALPHSARLDFRTDKLNVPLRTFYRTLHKKIERYNKQNATTHFIVKRENIISFYYGDTVDSTNKDIAEKELQAILCPPRRKKIARRKQKRNDTAIQLPTSKKRKKRGKRNSTSIILHNLSKTQTTSTATTPVISTPTKPMTVNNPTTTTTTTTTTLVTNTWFLWQPVIVIPAPPTTALPRQMPYPIIPQPNALPPLGGRARMTNQSK